MKNPLLSFIIFVLIINLNAFAQDFNDKPVATVGNNTITSSEMLLRYEMTPFFKKQMKYLTESLKLEFLYSLIAEKLWALQAQEMNYDTTDVMKFVNKQLKKMFVRDALYHREIANKVTITDADLKTGYDRYNSNLEVKFLFAESKNEIDNLYKMLKKGIPFDSVLSVRPEALEQEEPEEIVFGQMDESIEDSLYKLKIGEYSSPIYSPEGWYIFLLKNKIVGMIGGTEDETVKAVMNTIKARRELKYFREYYQKFFKDKKVTANAQLLRSLSEKLSRILSEKKINNKVEDKDPVYLDVADVLQIENEFGNDSLKMAVIEFEDDPISLKEFVEILTFDSFNTNKVDLKPVASALNSKVKTEIERELYAREGIKQGLDKLPDVQKDIKMWMENYLAQLLQSKFLDSAKVSDQDVINYYKNTNKNELSSPEINIVQVITDSAQLADKILLDIKNGNDIKKLAYLFSKHATAKSDSGETGFFPIASNFEIGKIASTMKVDSVYGPLKVSEGYLIFKLIGKRDSSSLQDQLTPDLMNKIRGELAYIKQQKAITDYTAELARKFGVNIDKQVLKTIEVTNINALGFRYLGFGGKVTAAPLMMPNVKWVDELEKDVIISP